MSGYSFENNPTAIEAAGFNFQPELVRKFLVLWTHWKSFFFTCGKLSSSITIRYTFPVAQSMF